MSAADNANQNDDEIREHAQCKLCLKCHITVAGSAYCKLGRDTVSGSHDCQDFEPKDDDALQKIEDQIIDDGTEFDDYVDLQQRHGKAVVRAVVNRGTGADTKALDKIVLMERGTRPGRKPRFNVSKLVDELFCHPKIEVSRFGGLQEFTKVKDRIITWAVYGRVTALQVRGFAGAAIHIAGRYTAGEAAEIAGVSRRTIFNHVDAVKSAKIGDLQAY